MMIFTTDAPMPNPFRSLFIRFLPVIMFLGISSVAAEAETECFLKAEGRDKVIAKATKVIEGVYLFRKVPNGKYRVILKTESGEYSTTTARNPLPVIVKYKKLTAADLEKLPPNEREQKATLRYNWTTAAFNLVVSVQGNNIGCQIQKY